MNDDLMPARRPTSFSRRAMPIRLRTLAAMMPLLAAAPLAAQPAPAPSTDEPRASSVTAVEAPSLDSRLIVEIDTDQAPRPNGSEAWADVVTRPWWHYPAIGAAIGAGAGLLHANSIMRGEYIGFPLAEPNVLLPIAYGAVGAFLGVLIDSSERERAARRD